ncbi:hypothetical protein [Corynebacterium sp.]|uniref:hypothetical protein n=1 Tax=Corynebacterium sp. TaxID=1720 RepID=UPI0028A8007D|nr:hypothetical protein [Corynebacterium sp.]
MLDEMRKRIVPEYVRLFHGEDGEVTPHFDDEGVEVFNFSGDTPTVFLVSSRTPRNPPPMSMVKGMTSTSCSARRTS